MVAPRMWSCASLTDGIDHLMSESEKVEEHEKELKKELMKLLQGRYIIKGSLVEKLPIYE